MRALVGRVLLAGVVGVVGSTAAVADPDPQPAKPPPPIVQKLPKDASALVGLTEVAKLAPTSGGFVDDAIGTDDTRIAYVIADAADKAELHVVALPGGEEQVVDLAPVTLHPIAITLVKDRAFVIGATEDGAQTAALVELAEKTVGKTKKPAGTVVYKLGPATHITVLPAATKTGSPRLAIHRAVAGKPSGTRHELELVALDTGKRIQAGRGLELDDGGANKPLGFRVNHWSDGFTRAYGIKVGEWDHKTDSRLPDVEATYDVVAGKFVDTAKIADLFEQRRRFQALAEAIDHRDFVRMAWDNSAIQVWHDGKYRAIELDQPLLSYDPKSLQGLVAADGSAWLLVKVDPVNAEAVARKKADLEYLDLFHVGATETKAVRKGRVFAPAGVRHRFGTIGDKVWLVERNVGFERGGKALSIYTVAP